MYRQELTFPFAQAGFINPEEDNRVKTVSQLGTFTLIR